MLRFHSTNSNSNDDVDDNERQGGRQKAGHWWARGKWDRNMQSKLFHVAIQFQGSEWETLIG